MSEDSKVRRERIDEIFNKYGDDILDFIEKNGVLVEGQFYLHSIIYKYEQEYIKEKLLQLGLEVLCDEAEEDDFYYNYLISGGYHNGNEKTEMNHFYYIYYIGHHNTYTLKATEDIAIDIYSSLL